MPIFGDAYIHLTPGAVYTFTPADVPDPPFRFFEGLVPRLRFSVLQATEAGRGLGKRLMFVSSAEL